MLQCKICNQEFNSYTGLAGHINLKHLISSKEYYIKYLKQNDEGICPICGKETKWFSFAAAVPAVSIQETIIAAGNRLPVDTSYFLVAVAESDSCLCRYYTAKGEDVCKSFGGKKLYGSVYSVN